MKIAIVGASQPSKEEADFIKKDIKDRVYEMRQIYGNDLIIVSGGASGVDTFAEDFGKENDIGTHIYKPEINQWDPPSGIGYKARNLLIAKNCDEIWCYPTHRINEDCVHCGVNTHQKGGGCWTAQQAKKGGKEIKIIEPW